MVLFLSNLHSLAAPLRPNVRPEPSPFLSLPPPFPSLPRFPGASGKPAPATNRTIGPKTRRATGFQPRPEIRPDGPEAVPRRRKRTGHLANLINSRIFTQRSGFTAAPAKRAKHDDMSQPFDNDIKFLTGVGEARANLLRTELGIRTRGRPAAPLPVPLHRPHPLLPHRRNPRRFAFLHPAPGAHHRLPARGRRREKTFRRHCERRFRHGRTGLVQRNRLDRKAARNGP